MNWEEIRRGHLHEWVIVEAIREVCDPATPAHLLRKLGPRRVSTLALIGYFQDPQVAMQEFCRLCGREPGRELYVLPTNLQNLNLDARPGLWSS